MPLSLPSRPALLFSSYLVLKNKTKQKNAPAWQRLSYCFLHKQLSGRSYRICKVRSVSPQPLIHSSFSRERGARGHPATRPLGDRSSSLRAEGGKAPRMGAGKCEPTPFWLAEGPRWVPTGGRWEVGYSTSRCCCLLSLQLPQLMRLRGVGTPCGTPEKGGYLSISLRWCGAQHWSGWGQRREQNK